MRVLCRNPNCIKALTIMVQIAIDIYSQTSEWQCPKCGCVVRIEKEGE